MKIQVTLDQDDLNQLHDVIYEVTGEAPDNETIIKYWDMLSDEIKGLAISWGTNDTEFRESMYGWLENNI